MGKFIPQTFINDLIARVDIVDVVNSYVTLKKNGANFAACCPFHQEKTPSFTVSRSKQFYYCFGCGAHGNAIGFLMNYLRLEFVDAIEELARAAGVAVVYEEYHGGPVQGAKQDETRQTIYELLQKAHKYYAWQLRQKENIEVVNYLKQRNLSGQIAKEYGLGFSPEGWSNILDALGDNPATIDLLQKCGLLIKNDNGRYYDRFRNRVMFPIYDRRGRIIGFGGRVINSDEQPKYLNSPETPVFHKGRELYGLYEAMQHNKNFSNILIVEGYMDVIALAQNGIYYAVATLGTATTQEHLRILFKHSKLITFCFDGDTAGKAAAWRALKIALPFMDGHNRVNFLFLPDGEDPDSLVGKEGKIEFEKQLKNAPSLSDYLLKELRGQIDLNSLEGRANFIALAVPYLRLLPDGPFAEMVTDEIAALTKMSANKIQQEVLKKPSDKRSEKINKVYSDIKSFSLIEKAISWLIQHPELAEKIEIPRLNVSDNDQHLLNELFRYIFQNKSCNTGDILQGLEKTVKTQRLAFLAAQKWPLEGEQLQNEFYSVIEQLNHRSDEEQLKILIEKARNDGLCEAEKKIFEKLLYQNRK